MAEMWRRRSLVLVSVLVIAGAVLWALLRPRPVFLVEEGFAPALAEALAVPESPGSPGAPAWPVTEFDPQTGPPAGGRRYGFIITTAPAAGETGRAAAEDSEVGPLRIYRDLQRGGGGAPGLPLALDPWLVFYRHSQNPPERQQMDGKGPTDGGLLLAGSDREALLAWAAQDLQQRPGTFPRDPESWTEKVEDLLWSRRFQQGAATFTWEDIWFRLFSSETGWVYAPLSRVQALPGSRTSLLEGRRFPERRGWNEYGLQARILWARPFGEGQGGKNLRIVARWLGEADTQSRIAGALKWVPAHRNAKPINPLVYMAQREWLASSYLWEAFAYANDE